MTRRPNTAALITIVLTFGLMTSSCTRKDKTAPVPESGVQTSATGGNQPATVIGCLRAGEASDTFVLTTGGEQPVTYQLRGGESETLRDNLGRQLEVSGTVTAEQRTATTATATSSERAVGTGGTPQVRTQTQLNIRTLEVSSVKATGMECK